MFLEKPVFFFTIFFLISFLEPYGSEDDDPIKFMRLYKDMSQFICEKAWNFFSC